MHALTVENDERVSISVVFFGLRYRWSPLVGPLPLALPLLLSMIVVDSEQCCSAVGGAHTPTPIEWVEKALASRSEAEVVPGLETLVVHQAGRT